MATQSQVSTALNEFIALIVGEGGNVNVADVDMDALVEAVNDEVKSGQRGSVLEIIINLNDSVGLDEFGIEID